MSITVLWLEDEFEDHQLQGTINKAIKKGFKIINCKYADEFISKIDTEKWDAIILDVIGQQNQNSSIGDSGFNLAFDKVLADYKNSPWFVFSGQSEITKKDSLIRQRLSAKHFNRGYAEVMYVKGQNNDMLFENISHAVKDNPLWQINERYANVLKVCTDKYIGDNSVNELTDILLNINGFKDINYKTYFTQLRIILELLFRAANKLGLLPNECFKAKGEVNLTYSSLFMAGKTNKENGLYCEVPHFPKIIADNVLSILNITGGASHTTNVEEKDLVNLAEYWKVTQSPYLLYSLTFMICDILIWYKQYADSHSDVDLNKALWQKKELNSKMSGIILKNDKNDFAFLKPNIGSVNCYISPKLVSKHGLVNGTQATVEYTIKEDKKFEAIKINLLT